MEILKYILAMALVAQMHSFKAIDEALKIVNKQIESIKTETLQLQNEIIVKTEEGQNDSLAKLLKNDSFFEFNINDHLYIFSQGSLFLVNETSVIQQLPNHFDSKSKPFLNKFSFGVQRLLIIEESRNSTTLISMPSANMTYSKSYSLNCTSMDKIVTVNNLIVAQKDTDIFLTTLEQAKYKKIFTLKDADEKIVDLLLTEIVYYIFTNKAIYFIDSYNLILRKIESFAVDIKMASFIKVGTEKYFLTLNQKNRLVFYLWITKFELEKMKQIPMKSNDIQIIDDYIIVNKPNKFQLYNIQSILLNKPTGINLLKTDRKHRIFGIYESKSAIKIFTRSPEFGLITYDVLSKLKQDMNNPFWDLIDTIYKPKYLIPMCIPILICAFAYIKIIKANKIREDEELKKKKQIENLFKAHKKRMEELNSQVTNLTEKVSGLGLDESLKEKVKTQVRKMR